ncbi:MAG: aminotransferase class IV [Spirochaetales bacterium]|nr:aminotransferase class IV [Spirochaetales bacterium]
MSQAWINGEFIDDKKLNISARDVGILRGYGVFDFLRTYGGEPFHLKDHLRRFFFSAEKLRLNIGYTLEELNSAIRELLKRNGYEESAIRMVCLGGESPSSMVPTDENTTYLIVEPFSADRSGLEQNQQKGVFLAGFPHLRYRAEVKTNNYIPAMDALHEAEQKGAFDALYCGKNGEIYETTRANVFFRIDGKWLTPKSDILIGITRSIVMSFIPEGELMEADLTLADLERADEAFLTSSTKEITPIVRIDDQLIGSGKPGPETAELIKRFNRYREEPALWAKREEEHPYGSF